MRPWVFPGVPLSRQPKTLLLSIADVHQTEAEKGVPAAELRLSSAMTPNRAGTAEAGPHRIGTRRRSGLLEPGWPVEDQVENGLGLTSENLGDQ